MAFNTPNFDNLSNLWLPGHTPLNDPPDASNIPGQLYVYSKVPYVFPGAYGNLPYAPPTIIFRHPMTYGPLVPGNIIEYIMGSADYYLVAWAQDLNVGYPNQYHGAWCVQCAPDGSSPRP